MIKFFLQILCVLVTSGASGYVMQYFLEEHIGQRYWQVFTVLLIYWLGRMSMAIEDFIYNYDR